MGFINPENLDCNKKSIPSFSMPQAERKDLALKGKLLDKFYNGNLSSIKRSEPAYVIPVSQRSKAEIGSKMGPGDY